jgi:hypothetical protein
VTMESVLKIKPYWCYAMVFTILGIFFITSYNSGYMVRLAKAILSQIAKATSYIRKRCTKSEA